MRRALLVAVFLGGFLALAFLFGGHAHAAESRGSLIPKGSQLRSTDDATTARLQHAVGTLRKTADEQAEQVDSAACKVLRPVLGTATQIIRPVGGVVQGATGLPVTQPSGGSGTADHPVRSAPGPASDHAFTSGSGDGVRPAKATAFPGAEVRGAAHLTRRHFYAGHAVQPGSGHRQAPFDFPRAPSAPAFQFTSDSGSPRGADTHATLPSDRTSFGLVAGAVRAASGAPTREVSADVLEFPA